MRISIRKIDCSLTNKCPKASHELMDLKFYCHYYFLSFSISQTLRFIASPGSLVKRADSDSVGRGEAGDCTSHKFPIHAEVADKGTSLRNVSLGLLKCIKWPRTF